MTKKETIEQETKRLLMEKKFKDLQFANPFRPPMPVHIIGLDNIKVEYKKGILIISKNKINGKRNKNRKD